MARQKFYLNFMTKDRTVEAHPAANIQKENFLNIYGAISSLLNHT